MDPSKLVVDDIRGRGDELALHGLVPDDTGVVQGVGAADGGLGQFGQIQGPAHVLQAAHLLQLLGGGDQIDGGIDPVEVLEARKR